jgi:hypothetical protein
MRKPADTVEEEFGKEVIALFIGEGEDAQEIEALPGADNDPPEALPVGGEGLPVASIESIIPGYPGGGVSVYPDQTIEFAGSAEDNDADGNPSIVAYEWRSDKNGILSTQATFTTSASTLMPGTHIISFRAQDNEGNWSDWDQVTIEVLTYGIYLPLILR